MRTIVHLSDIHFGKVHTETLQPLISCIHGLKPDLVVVSGDITQLALKRQFREARGFLMKLPGPQIVVPGNHDVTIFNPVERMLAPLGRFKRYITRNMYPFFEDEEMAVLGLNTARKTMTRYGHVSQRQLKVVKERIGPVSNTKLKIIVTHHPFDIPKGYRNERQIVKRSQRAMKVLAECEADLFLAGHLHTGFIGNTIERYKFANHSALIIQAGTASSRGHAEPNSFNLLEVSDHQIRVRRYSWNKSLNAFDATSDNTYRHTPAGWLEILSGELDDQDADKRQNSATQ